MEMQFQSYPLHTKLHSEVLKEQFGKIDVHVLSDDDNTREVLLTDEAFIAKTYAITFKDDGWKHDAEICMVNNAIKNGESIGEAFKSRGFVIQKNILDVYIIQVPEWLQLAFTIDNKKAKARTAEFIIKKNNIVYNYGIVTEIYSPDFRTPQVSEADKQQINIPSSVLKSLGFSKEDIWNLLAKKTTAPNLAKLYASVAEEIKEKVNNIVHEAFAFSVI